MAAHLLQGIYNNLLYPTPMVKTVQLFKSHIAEISSSPPRSSTLQALSVGQGHSAPVTDGKERALTISRQNKVAEGPHLPPRDGTV